MLNQKFEPQKQNHAFTAMALRLTVAAYIAVLGYKIITNQDTSMPPVLAMVLGGVMIFAAVLFCVYIGIRWKADKQAAENMDTQEKEQTHDDTK